MKNKFLILTLIIVFVLSLDIFAINHKNKPLNNDVCLSLSNIAYDCYKDGYNKLKTKNTVDDNGFCEYFHVKGYIDGISDFKLTENKIKQDVYKKCLYIQKQQNNKIEETK